MQFGVAEADAVDSVAIIVCDDEQSSLLLLLLLLLCLLSFVSTKINNARTKLVLMCVHVCVRVAHTYRCVCTQK